MGTDPEKGPFYKAFWGSVPARLFWGLSPPDRQIIYSIAYTEGSDPSDQGEGAAARNAARKAYGAALVVPPGAAVHRAAARLRPGSHLPQVQVMAPAQPSAQKPSHDGMCWRNILSARKSYGTLFVRRYRYPENDVPLNIFQTGRTSPLG